MKTYITHPIFSFLPKGIKAFLLFFITGIALSLHTQGQVVQTFNSSGTFTVPTGVTTLQIECWGGGGGGGGASANNSSGGGGGGGAYAKNISVTVTPGNTYTVTVGTGGAAGAAAGGNGGAGLSSSFNTTSVIATGGSGGSGVSTANTGGAGGAGGTGSTGVTIFNGGSGAAGVGSGVAGGGGSSAGTAANGNNGSGVTGGAAPTGGGAGGNGGASNTAGSAGSVPGGAGGGGRRTATTNRAGGAGAAGKVVITYTQPACSGTPAPGNVVSTANPVCSGSNFTLSLSNSFAAFTGITYQWQQSTVSSSGPWTNLGTAATQATSATANRWYQCLVTCANGGATGTSAFLAETVTPLPTVSVTPSAATFCTGNSGIPLTASGATTYVWSPVTNLSPSAGTSATETASPTVTRTYTVTGTTSGCSSSTTVTVTNAGTAPSPPTVTATPPTICLNGSSTLNASNVVASPIASYSFSQSTTTYTPISGGTVLGSGFQDDDTYSPVNIGFNFIYHGVSFSTIGADANGIAVLGATSLGFDYGTALSAETNCICPFNDDLNADNGADQLRYSVTGTPGSQVFTMEWFNWGFFTDGGVSEINFQLKLFEGTNVIQFVYQPTSPQLTPFELIQVGLTGAAVTDFIGRRSTNPHSWATTSPDANNTQGVRFTNAIFPANGLTFTFVPPVVNFTYTWSPATFLNSTTGATVVASNVSASTTYTVSGSNGACASSASVSVTAGASLTAAPTAVSAGPSSYCTPTSAFGCSGFGDEITHVSYAGINRTSTCDGYIYVASPAASVTAGSPNALSVTTGVNNTTNEGVAVWIDLNQNGVFDGSELLYSSYSGADPATYNTNITIPVTALNGTTRMRVACMYSQAPTDPCTNTSYGEAEDYNVVISGGVNPGPPCGGTPFQLSANATGGGAPYTYSWSPTTSLSNPTIANPVATPNSSTTYTVTVHDFCGAQTSAPVTVTVTTAPTVTVSPAAFCIGQPVTLTASGAATFTWSPSTGLNTTSGSVVVANPLAPIVYTVSGTNGGLCAGTTTVAAYASPVLSSVVASPSAVLSGGSSTLTANASQPASVTNYTFSSSTGTFVPLVGGTAVPDILFDDAASGSIPIGFSFNFEGVNYTSLNASSNGILSLGGANASLTNDLTGDPVRPIIAPLWDDQEGASGSASYMVTGTPGNQVFTFEWLNWIWVYFQPTPTISYQVKLYEASGRIEFIYRQESGSLDGFSEGASIGLGGAASGEFLSLNNSSASPLASSALETTTINQRPATGQIYTFLPPSTGLTYLWTPSTFLTSTTTNPTVANGVTTSTIYTVTVTNSGGCSVSGSDTVEVSSMVYDNTVITQVSSPSCTSPGALNVPILRMAVQVDGLAGTINMDGFQVDLGGTSSPSWISNARIYYTGTSPVFGTTTQYAITTNAGNTFGFSSWFMGPSGNAPFPIGNIGGGATTTHYFWLAYDVYSGAAACGGSLDGQISMVQTDNDNIEDDVSGQMPVAGFTAVSIANNYAPSGNSISTCGGTNLSWSRACGYSGNYDVYLNGSLIASNINGTNAVAMVTPGNSYTWQVQNAGSPYTAGCNLQTFQTASVITPAAAISPITGPSGATCGNALTYSTASFNDAIQWQISTDNVVFGDISGATSGTYVLSSNTSPGSYYLRAYAVASGLCSSDTVFSNVLTVVITPPSCSIVSTTSGPVCSGASNTLTATGPAPYLWSTGATTQSIVVSPGVTTTYSVIAGTFVAVSPYCAAGASTNGCNTGDEFIANVTFNTINNNSTCPGSGQYQDFTSLSTNITAGSSYSASISCPDFFSGDQFTVWIDFNHNGILNDPGEEFSLSSAAVATGTVSIPSGALNGPTRMRVRVSFFDIIDPCGTTTFGEVEDYTVVISGGVNPAGECNCTSSVTITVDGPILALPTATPSGNACPGSARVLNAGLISSLPGTGMYSITSTSFAPLACPSNPGPTGDDAILGNLPIGFTFNYFGVNYTQFGISTNGNIQLGDGSGSANNPIYDDTFIPTDFPDATTPNNTIAGLWADLIASSGQITYGTTGSAPNRKLVVCFTNVPFLGSGDLITTQIILSEGSNLVTIHLTSTGGDVFDDRVLGIENADGTVGGSPSGRELGTWDVSNEAWLFTPSAGTTLSYNGPVTYNWSPGGGTGSSITVNPSVTTTYTVNIADASCLGSFTVTVPVDPVTVSPNVTICSGSSATLTASPVLSSYVWSTGETTQSIIVSPTVTTTYTVDMVNGLCPQSVTVAVNGPNANPSVTPSGTQCPGLVRTLDAGTITGNLNGPVTYIWSPSISCSNVDCSSGTVSPSVSTTYSLTISDGVCSQSYTVPVSVYNAPTVTASNNGPVCSGGSATLTAVGSSTAPVQDGSTYILSSIPFAPVSTAGTTLTLANDQLSGAIPLGFTFRFYGVNYTQVYISSNGYITFDNSGLNGCCQGQTLPSASAPNNLIALDWEDLNPNAGTGVMTYSTTGSVGSRIFAFSLSNVRHTGGGAANAITGQILLYEGANRIEFHEANVHSENDGVGETQGVENASGTSAVTVSGRNNQDNWASTNQAFAFTPPSTPITYLWSPGGSTNAVTSVTVANTSTYTVTVTDSHGCTASATTTVDVILPTIVCPADITVCTDAGQCSAATANLGTPTLGSQPCGHSAAPSTNGPFSLGDNFVTWTVTDQFGNTATCVQKVTVTDCEAPVPSCPAEITLDCVSPNTDPSNTGTATATDNCAMGTITYSDVITADNCQANYTIHRTWTATDAAGNSASCVQLIHIVDSTPPVISGFCFDQTLECPDSPVFCTLTATDNCSTYTLNFVDASTPTCGGSYIATRTWTATDACGNVSTQVQTITVEDLTAPVITGVGPTMVILCPDTPVFSTPVATDECASADLTYFDDIMTFCSGSYIVTRYWTATDGCGNTSSDFQQIIVLDFAAPVISGVDADASIECPQTPVWSNPTAVDGCSNAYLTYDDQTTTFCGGTYTTTRTWTATDDCNNQSQASQTITVTDNTAPVITGVNASSTIECPGAPVFSTPAATDACSSSSLNFTDVTTAGCGGSYSTTRTWTATDECGNVSTASETITVEDVTAPVITGVGADQTIECPQAPVFSTPSQSDECSASGMSFTDVTTNGCGGSYTTTRTWTATDACGNHSSASQSIHVEDHTGPVISGVGANQVLECPATITFSTPTQSDACSASNMTFATVTTPGCGTTYSQTRTWTATDACGNVTTASQTISIQDHTAPVISGVLPTQTINCPATPNFCTPVATDACNSVVVTYNDVNVAACGGTYSRTRTWTAVDACGNVTTASQTINVVDHTAPVISGISPALITIQCPATPVFGSAIATDGCSGAGMTLTFSDATTTLCGGAYSRVRTWTATDGCGNVSHGSQTVNVIDNTAPVITSVQANATIQCPATPVWTAPTATDACGTATIGSSDATTTICGGSYIRTRTWTATDGCGNHSSVSRTTTVQDLTAPVIAGVGANATINCPATPVFSNPVATDACSSVTLAFNDVTTTICGGSYSKTRTWTATDACGNHSSASQTITVQDVTAPVITGVGSASTIQCPASPAFSSPTATDACGTATLTFNDVTTNGCGGSYTRTRTWTATDGCGNHSSASQTITVVDNTAPVITGVGANTTIDCPASPAFSSPVSTDACGSSTLTFADVTTTGICPGNYVTTRTWTATDGCGNHSSASQTITVHDVTAPVITCPATIYLCASDLSPALTNATATDGCSSVAISHTACPSNFPTGTTPITWTATDLCGNTASCVQNVVRNSAITVSIAASGAISGYCQGSNAVTLTATGAGGTGTLSYLWSTGATSQSIFVNVTGSYTCTVTDQFGHPCSASATYVFQTNSSSDLSSYTIIGRDKVHLHGYNVVQNGGIGATTVTGSASSGHQGWVKVHDHSSMNALTTFARAASIEVDGTSLVMNQILSAANPTLPAFDNGLPPNTTNVNVPAFTTVTLNATTYGDITVGAGATLIFGHATVDLKNLYVAHDATVQFAQACTRLRMSSQLDLDRNVVFNPDADGKDVAVYLKHINNEGSGHGSANYSFGYGSGGGALTSVNVEYGASVKAFIYAPNGKIDVHGGASGSTATNGNTSSAFSSTATTTMKGLFIARSVKAHGRTNWNWNTVCSSCNYALRETEGDAASSLKSEELTSGLLIENFPDPFQDKTTIRFVMDKDTHATVNVYDLNGKFITTVFSGDVTAKKEYKLEFDGSGLSNGMYIYKVITADDVHTGKMLLIKE